MNDRSAVFSVVGTPIGNLGDITFRAAAVLLAADAVICEDTRRTGKLLAHMRQLAADGLVSVPSDPGVGNGSVARPDSIAQPGSVAGVDRVAVGDRPRADLLVANEHTEFGRIPEILDRLHDGQRLALVTDAGMPAVSDPGMAIVRAVAEAGYRIEVVPGPSAVSAALALAGMAAERFVFEGFLPRRGTERQLRLKTLSDEDRTVVLYEAPHRVLKTLRDLAAGCGGDRPVVIARELTKLHEEADHTTLAEAAKRFAAETPRGEFVLVVAAAPRDNAPPTDRELIDLVDQELAAGSSTRDAVAAVVAQTGQPKRRIYDLANSRTDRGGDVSEDSPR